MAGATEQAQRTGEAGEDGTLARAKAALAKCGAADRTSRRTMAAPMHLRLSHSCGLALLPSLLPPFAHTGCLHRSHSLRWLSCLRWPSVGSVFLARSKRLRVGLTRHHGAGSDIKEWEHGHVYPQAADAVMGAAAHKRTQPGLLCTGRTPPTQPPTGLLVLPGAT